MLAGNVADTTPLAGPAEAVLESGLKEPTAPKAYQSIGFTTNLEDKLPNAAAAAAAEEGEEVVIHLHSRSYYFLTAFALCLAYWLLSGGLTLFNKWFFSHHGFPFPVLTVMCTMGMHAIMTQIIVRALLPSRLRQYVPTPVFFRYLLPVAICSALEIASSNLAIVKLSVSFHTMVHASKPVFFAIWSVILGLEEASCRMAGIVLLVTFGVILLSLGESSLHLTPSEAEHEFFEAKEAEETGGLTRRLLKDSFHLDSFLLILFSCFISGLRWTVAQLMLQRVSINKGSREKLMPINLLYYTSPFGSFALLPFFLAFELPRLQVYMEREDVDITGDLLGFGLLISVWALVMTLVEFYLVKQTSAILFSFAAILKEIMVITIAILVNGDSLPALNVIGFIFCIAGIIAYQRSKTSKYEEIKG